MTEIRLGLPGGDAATSLIASLTEAGIDPDTIVLSVPDARESSFITRLVIAIALWSVVGAVVGVGLGALIWLVLGPEGETGFVIQAVVWGIFGHLIAGLWTGYLLLADRTQEDLPHDRPDMSVTLTVVCPDDATAAIVADVVERSGMS